MLLAHEWVHAYLHEPAEVPAYLFEIAVLKTYLDQKKLPPQYEEELKQAEAALRDASTQNQAGQDPVIHGISQPKPSPQ